MMCISKERDEVVKGDWHTEPCFCWEDLSKEVTPEACTVVRIQPGAELGQESQASSCLRKGTPLAPRVAQGVSGPASSCVWNPRFFPDDARGCQCRLGLCLHPRVTFEEGPLPRS